MAKYFCHNNKNVKQPRVSKWLGCGIAILALSAGSASASLIGISQPAFLGGAPSIPSGGGGGFPMPSLTATFDIVLDYSGSTTAPTAAELAAFASAEAQWEGIINGMQDTLGDDSLNISVDLRPIDGVGGTLGSAGPTIAKWGPENNFLYSEAGIMNFDTADTANLNAGGFLDEVILHEMGHVLGIGTLWSSSGVGLPGRQELYINNSGQYTGAAGIAAYNSEFGQASAFVPVELGGGAGTANGHWNEVDGGIGPTGILSGISGQDMQFELMTGWLNTAQPTFLSTLTSQSLVDIGYVVTVIPEPSSMVMFSMLVVAARLLSRRRG